MEHTARNRNVSANRRSAKNGICMTHGPRAVFPAMPRLVAPFNRIALRDPICAQIISEIQNIHVSEAHVVQLLESWSQVGTTVPRTAAAVQDDSLLLRKRGDRALQLLQTSGLGTCTGIHGAGNMGLIEEKVRTDLEQQWLICSLGLKQMIQHVGLD